MSDLDELHDEPGEIEPDIIIELGPTDWQDGAACVGTDPDLFFPERGQSTREAKAVCADCPVSAECLEYALTTGQKFGIWGGRSERERRALRRERGGLRKPPKPIDHGTRAGWFAHRRRGESPCDPCKAAYALSMAERRERARAVA